MKKQNIVIGVAPTKRSFFEHGGGQAAKGKVYGCYSRYSSGCGHSGGY